MTKSTDLTDDSHPTQREQSSCYNAAVFLDFINTFNRNTKK